MAENTQGGNALVGLLGGSAAAASPLLFVVGMLLVLGVFQGSPRRASTPESPPPPAASIDESSAQSPSGLPDADIRETLVPLWQCARIEPAAYEPPAAPEASAPAALDRGLEALFERVRSGRTLGAVIATLPDPLESQAEYEFDMGLEAIQRSIESEGYVLDRFSKPWRAPSTTSSGASDPALKLHRQRPACLLFRKADANSRSDEPDLLLLLVVGESPSWGVHPGAMRTSLEIARLVADPGSRTTVKILGPTYSGSANSIADALAPWLDDHPHVDAWVCSGSATGVDKKAFEGRAFRRPEGAPSARVIFQSTAHPDELLFSETLRYLGNPNPGGANVKPIGKTVLLVEGGTAYGNQFFRYIDQLARILGNDLNERVLFIPFPRRISYLRGIPELTRSDALPLAAESQTPAQPAIPLAEHGASSAVFPPFDPQVTGATDSLVLTQILGTIAREQARYVGIMASEVRNALLLVRLIRRYCPDVQIFLLNNDILFTYADFAPEFHGTIIASTYPLDSRAQRWAFPNEGGSLRRVFANELDIGRYNAFLFLFNSRPHPGTGLGQPGGANRLVLADADAEDLLLYGSPFADRPATAGGEVHESRPSLWWNVVGRDGVWPVRAVGLADILERTRTDPRFASLVGHRPETIPPLSPEHRARAAEHIEKGLRASRTLAQPADWAWADPRFLLAMVRGLERVVESRSRPGDGATDSNDPGQRTSAWRRTVAGFDAIRTLAGEQREDLVALQQSLDLAEKEPGKFWEAFHERFWAARERQFELDERLSRTLGLTAANSRPGARVAWPLAPLRRVLQATTGPLTSIVEIDAARRSAWWNHVAANRPGTPTLAGVEAEVLRHVDEVWPTTTPALRDGTFDESVRQEWMALAREANGLARSLVELARYVDRWDPTGEQRTPGQARFDALWRGYLAQHERCLSAIKRFAHFQETRPESLDSQPATAWANQLRDMIGPVHDALLARPVGGASPPATAGDRPRHIHDFQALALYEHKAGQVEAARDLVPAVLDTGAMRRVRPGAVDKARAHQAAQLLDEVSWPYWAILIAIGVGGIGIGKFAHAQFQAYEGAPRHGGEESRPRKNLASRIALLLCLVMIASLVGLAFASPILVLLAPRLGVSPGRFDAWAWASLAVAVAFLAPLLGVAFWLIRRSRRIAQDRLEDGFLFRLCLLGTGIALLASLGRPLWLTSPTLVVWIWSLGMLSVVLAALAWSFRAAWAPAPAGDPGARRALLAIVPIVLAILVILWFTVPEPWPWHAELLRASRVIHLDSGVSPLPTMLLIGAALASWCIFRVRYLDHTTELLPPCRALASSDLADRPPIALQDCEQRVGVLRGVVRAWLPSDAIGRSATALAIVLALGLVLSTVLIRLTPSIDGWGFDALYRASYLFFVVVYVLTFAHLLRYWRALSAVLRSLAALPIDAVYTRLPAPVSEIFGRFLTARAPRCAEVEAAERALTHQYAASLASGFEEDGMYRLRLTRSPIVAEGERKLVVIANVDDRLHFRIFDGKGRQVEPDPARLGESEDDLKRQLAGMWDLDRVDRCDATRILEAIKSALDLKLELTNPAPSTPLEKDLEKWYVTDPPSRETFRRLLERLRCIADKLRPGPGSRPADDDLADELAEACRPLVFRAWSGRSPAVAFGVPGQKNAGAPISKDDMAASWLAQAEELVLIRLLFDLKRLAPPLRDLAMFLLVAPVLMLFATTVYPFQPERMLGMILWVMVLLGAALTAWVFVQVDRDPFVSRASGTKPNVVDLDAKFLGSLQPLLIPIVGLVWTAFPNLGFWIGNLLEPIGRAIR